MNDVIKSIQTLKTTRSSNFSEERISTDDFDMIIESCIKAPNASNRQSYSIIVLEKVIKFFYLLLIFIGMNALKNI